MVSLSQAASDQVSDATAPRYSGAQRTWAVCPSLAFVLSDAHQLPFGHPRSAEDVGHGALPERLPLEGRRVLDSGLARILREAARAIQNALGNLNTFWGVKIARLQPRRHAFERLGTLEPITCVTGAGLHLGLCRRPLASECQRTETEETWLSAKEYLPPRTRYLVSFSNQLRALRSCYLAEGYQTFVL